MAVCKYCGKEMLVHTSCLPYIYIDGERFERIKYGKEKVYNKHRTPSGTCGDCGCRIGDYHHFNCDSEINPKTGKQLLLDIIGDKDGKRIYPSKQ